MRRAALLLALLLGPLLAAAQAAQVPQLSQLPASRAEARIEGRALPALPLRLADGSAHMLSELGRDQDLLLTFFYRRCAGVCVPFLQWVRDATREVGGLGDDYRVLALSFDEADTVADLQAQAASLDLQDHPDWTFAVTDAQSLARTAAALDFWYRRLAGSDQYDHGSLLVAIRDGRVLRVISGAPGQTQRLRELVWELRGKFVPYYASDEAPALRCIEFDPRSGALRLDWGMVLLVAPALAALAATLVVFRPRRPRGLHPREPLGPLALPVEPN